MNKRIQELISSCRDVDYIGFDETVHYSFNEEKFAELIVRECITVARGADGLDATHEAWYLIKEHFGVEE